MISQRFFYPICHGKTENMEQEASKIRQAIPNGCYVVILDEKGKIFTSTEFANHINSVSINYSHVCFIIGGADGIDKNLKSNANFVLQLSQFTFPHGLVRVIMLEQIYRAISTEIQDCLIAKRTLFWFGFFFIFVRRF